MLTKKIWAVVVPAFGALALNTMSTGLTHGPLAFAAGFGIGLCMVATLAGVVALVKAARQA
jgi:hypothetical protein